MRKALAILLVVLFLATMTVTAVSAGYPYYGKQNILENPQLKAKSTLTANKVVTVGAFGAAITSSVKHSNQGIGGWSATVTLNNK